MKANSAHLVSDEPMGIVISRGAHQEQAPTVFAYVWGPAPEDEPEASKILSVA